MCHSSERWTFWSRREQQKTPESLNRSEPRRTDPVVRSVEPAAEPRKDEKIRREKELERVS